MNYTLANEAELIAEAMAAVFERLHRSGSGPNPWLALSHASGSGPIPWRTQSPAVSLFVSGIGMRQVASNLPEGQTKHEILSAVSQTIADWEDDYCGTPPHPLPSLGLAAELAAFASSLEEGALRTDVLGLAAQIAGRAFGGTERSDATQGKKAA